MIDKVAEEFGGRIRIRVCGVCLQAGKVLLVNHSGVYQHDFWAPPGGGVEFGEGMEKTLKREFQEECHSYINVGKFLFGCEFIRQPLHGVELYYEVELTQNPVLGGDPELVDHQVISDLKFMSMEEIKKLPNSHRHQLFNQIENLDDFKRLSGFFTFT